MPPERQQVAVIGAGIAGLSTAWLLQHKHTVTLFEQEPQLGGHAHTVVVDDPTGPVPIDTGFVVFNQRNYPHLTQLFAHLGVQTQPTDMSFAYALHPSGLEYAGTSLNTLFAQRRNLLRPRFLRMVGDILRFNRLGKAYLDSPGHDNTALGDFLEQHRFGNGFREDYLLPMAAAIWSCPPRMMQDFPLRNFLAFFRNHGLLDLSQRPQWHTVVGGSQDYVRRLQAACAEVRIEQAKVTELQRTTEGWQVITPSSPTTHPSTTHPWPHFDAVVLACHADQALRLLSSPTPQQQRILSACRFQSNRAILHRDPRLMPRSRRVWSSWNYLAQRHVADPPQVSVTYYMNHLHRLQQTRDYFVSLNPWQEPHPDTLITTREWHHPIIDGPAAAAQLQLDEVQGEQGVYFAGAWTGFGFHEDGIRSAIRVARHFACSPPWEQQATSTEVMS